MVVGVEELECAGGIYFCDLPSCLSNFGSQELQALAALWTGIRKLKKMLYSLHQPTLLCQFKVSANGYLSLNIVCASSGNDYEILISLVGEKLLYCMETFGVMIVVGQTGCGKTTRELCMSCSLLYA